jgi:YidC/Oxa1 family membrane protein insertase
MVTVLMFVWMKFFPPEITPPQPSSVEAGDTVTIAETGFDTGVQPVRPSMAQTPEDETTVDELIEDTPFVPEEITPLTNGLAHFEFSNIGGVLKRVVLIPDNVNLHKEVDLFRGEMLPDEYPFAISSGSGPLMSLAKYPFKLESTESGRIVYSCERNGLKIIKEYTLSPDDYLVSLTLTFENMTDSQISIDSYRIGSGAIFPSDPLDMRPVYEYCLSGKKLKKIKPPKKGKEVKKVAATFGLDNWGGVMNRYIALVMSQGDQESRFTKLTINPKKIVGTDLDEETAKPAELYYYPAKFSLGATKFAPQSITVQTYSLYMGTKEYPRLFNLGYEKIRKSWLSSIEKPMLWLIKAFYKVIPNYGVAIILLTVLIKVLLYPLDQKSYKSMKEMQRVQPLVAELKEKFKDDPRKVQQETMKLYKEHKVNPFGGCLPMLLQMPVLFAMFHTLQKAVQLWGAPFALWITDLSQPDSLIMFSQKFLIFDRLNILPIFMLVSFYLQQKIMAKSQAQDPQQKMMQTMMLVVFGYIFYNMPAGLNLYFTISTLLRTLQQYLVQKHK